MSLNFNANLAAKAGAKRAPLAAKHNQQQVKQAQVQLNAQQPAFQGGKKLNILA